MIRIYLDADSLYSDVRRIVLKRVEKEGFEAYFVADRSLSDVVEASKRNSGVKMIVVDPSLDSADNKIVEIATYPSLAITHDIPLASRLIEKNIMVIDNRGIELNRDNIRERLSNRDLMAEFREMGVFPEKKRYFDKKAVESFSNSFDRAIAKLKRVIESLGVKSESF